MSAQEDIKKFKDLIPIHQARLVGVREEMKKHSERTSDCDEQFRAFVIYGEGLSNQERDILHWISECKRLIAFNEQWIKDHPVSVKKHELVF